jgi:D-alanine transfer protein
MGKKGFNFIVTLLIPARWFTGLVTEKTVEDNRTSLTDQVLKGTLIQDKLYESNKYYPIYLSSTVFSVTKPVNQRAGNNRKTMNTAPLIKMGKLWTLIEMSGQHQIK